MSIKTIVLFLIFIVLLSPINSVHAQIVDDRHSWSFGLQAGVLSGNIASATATNALVSRFNVGNDYYFTTAFQAGYVLSDYESIHLNLSRGEFSVFTDHEFWPDVIFNSQFYTASLSTQLGLRRFMKTLPDRLDPYGLFGMGLMSYRTTVSPFDPLGTDQNDLSGSANNLSFLITTGLGVDYSLSSRISITFQFNHNFLSSDIIDKNLAGEILQNDFIKTTNSWSTITSGLSFKFGRTKARTQTEPFVDDFQIVSTLDADSIEKLEEQVSDISDSVVESIAKSDSTDIQAPKDLDPFESADEISTPQEIPEETPKETPVAEVTELAESDEDELVLETQPRFGLTGITVEEIPGSFAITLHSFINHDNAISAISKLNAEGYRVVTQIVNINGKDYKRVAIGQFENRRNARSAAQSLPEPYRSNYFLIRL